VPSVVFSPSARAELLEARDWYAARDVEPADRFIAEIPCCAPHDRRFRGE
jgi:hypothetical protein